MDEPQSYFTGRDDYIDMTRLCRMKSEYFVPNLQFELQQCQYVTNQETNLDQFPLQVNQINFMFNSSSKSPQYESSCQILDIDRPYSPYQVLNTSSNLQDNCQCQLMINEIKQQLVNEISFQTCERSLTSNKSFDQNISRLSVQEIVCTALDPIKVFDYDIFQQQQNGVCQLQTKQTKVSYQQADSICSLYDCLTTNTLQQTFIDPPKSIQQIFSEFTSPDEHSISSQEYINGTSLISASNLITKNENFSNIEFQTLHDNMFDDKTILNVDTPIEQLIFPTQPNLSGKGTAIFIIFTLALIIFLTQRISSTKDNQVLKNKVKHPCNYVLPPQQMTLEPGQLWIPREQYHAADPMVLWN